MSPCHVSFVFGIRAHFMILPICAYARPSAGVQWTGGPSGLVFGNGSVSREPMLDLRVWNISGILTKPLTLCGFPEPSFWPTPKRCHPIPVCDMWPRHGPTWAVVHSEKQMVGLASNFCRDPLTIGGFPIRASLQNHLQQKDRPICLVAPGRPLRKCPPS